MQLKMCDLEKKKFINLILYSCTAELISKELAQTFQANS